MSLISTILPSEAIKAMERGIIVFFIQKERTSSLSKTKSIPSPSFKLFLCIRPWLRSSGVRAISAFTATGAAPFRSMKISRIVNFFGAQLPKAAAVKKTHRSSTGTGL
jgi:hypothetical protein